MTLTRSSAGARRFVWREIHWPAELAPEVAVAVLRQLGTDHFVRLIALEVEARAGAVIYRIGVPAPAAARVEQLFAALVPGSAMTPAGATSGATRCLARRRSVAAIGRSRLPTRSRSREPS